MKIACCHFISLSSGDSHCPEIPLEGDCPGGRIYNQRTFSSLLLSTYSVPLTVLNIGDRDTSMAQLLSTYSESLTVLNIGDRDTSMAQLLP